MIIDTSLTDTKTISSSSQLVSMSRIKKKLISRLKSRNRKTFQVQKMIKRMTKWSTSTATTRIALSGSRRNTITGLILTQTMDTRQFTGNVTVHLNVIIVKHIVSNLQKLSTQSPKIVYIISKNCLQISKRRKTGINRKRYGLRTIVWLRRTSRRRMKSRRTKSRSKNQTNLTSSAHTIRVKSIRNKEHTWNKTKAKNIIH